MYLNEHTQADESAIDRALNENLSARDIGIIQRNIGRTMDVVEFIRKLRSHRPQLPAMKQAMHEEYKRFGEESKQNLRAEAARLGIIGAHDEPEMIEQMLERNEPMSLLLLAFRAPLERKTLADNKLHQKAADAAALIANEGYMMASAAMDFGDQYVITRMHPSAIATVRDTDLAFWPSACPKPLTRPMLVQADRSKGKGFLFHNIHTLLWVPHKDGTQNILVQGEEGFGRAVTNITWNKDRTEAISQILRADIDACFMGKNAMDDKIAFEAVVQWVVKLALFFEAESTGGRRMTECEPRQATLPDGRPPPKGQSFTVRYLRISDEALTRPQRESGADRPPPPHADNLVSREVTVRGFLRRQVCGKGGKDRKVIYVAPFRRQQWVSPEAEVRVL